MWSKERFSNISTTMCSIRSRPLFSATATERLVHSMLLIALELHTSAVRNPSWFPQAESSLVIWKPRLMHFPPSFIKEYPHDTHVTENLNFKTFRVRNPPHRRIQATTHRRSLPAITWMATRRLLSRGRRCSSNCQTGSQQRTRIPS